jgi:hypothetical protein
MHALFLKKKNNRGKHAINTLKIRPFKPIKPLEEDADDWLFVYTLQNPNI